MDMANFTVPWVWSSTSLALSSSAEAGQEAGQGGTCTTVALSGGIRIRRFGEC